VQVVQLFKFVETMIIGSFYCKEEYDLLGNSGFQLPCKQFYSISRYLRYKENYLKYCLHNNCGCSNTNLYLRINLWVSVVYCSNNQQLGVPMGRNETTKGVSQSGLITSIGTTSCWFFTQDTMLKCKLFWFCFLKHCWLQLIYYHTIFVCVALCYQFVMSRKQIVI